MQKQSKTRFPVESEIKPTGIGVFWKNIAKLVSGTALSQALIFLTIPLLTRLYSPEAFGVAALFTSIVLFLAPMASLGYQQAIIIPEKKLDAHALCFLSLLILTIVTIVLLIPFALFSKEVALFFNVPALEGIVWLIPLAIFSRGVYLVLAMDSTRKKTYGLQAVSTVVQTTIDRIIILGVGFMGYATGATIIWGRFYASLCETGTFYHNLKDLIRNRKKMNRALIKQVAMAHKNFPLFANWVTFFSLGASHLPIYTLSYFFSPEVTGLYALTNRLLYTPMQLLGDSIRRVYYQTAANDQHNQEVLKVFFQDLSEKLIGYGLFPFVVLIVAGEDLFAFLLCAQWAVAGQYAQILCFLIAAQFICTPIAGLVNVIGKQKTFLWFTFLLFTSRFISLIVGGFFNDPFLTLWLLVLSGVFFYGYVRFWICNCLGIKHFESFKVVLKYGLVNLLFACIIVFTQYLGFNRFYLIMIILITTILYYLTALFLVDNIIPSFLLIFFNRRERRGEDL